MDFWFNFIVIIKLIHLIIFFIAGNHCFSINFFGISKTLSNHDENTKLNSFSID